MRDLLFMRVVVLLLLICCCFEGFRVWWVWEIFFVDDVFVCTLLFMMCFCCVVDDWSRN